MLYRALLSLFLMPLFVSVYFIDINQATASGLKENPNFIKWQWLKNDCDRCEVLITPVRSEVRTKKVLQFVEALSVYKSELQSMYQIHGADYNLLAHMSVGILGRESLFFNSKRYQVKEALPWVVHLAKIIQIYLEGSEKSVSPNSRGPTQIKVVPAKVAERYNINSENLYIPENAAIATMAFLIEAYYELNRRIEINNLDFVTPEKIVDYLPYIYFGSTKALVNHSATPEANLYVRDMKRYMTWFEVYERPSGLELNNL